MNIGLMGYYGFGNAGDEAILEALTSFLAPHHVVAFPSGFIPNVETISRLNLYDFLILGGGGLYQKKPPGPFGTFDQWENQLRTPIGVLGLGVQQIDDKYTRATQELVNRTDFFIVRDKESKRIISHPKVQAAPDLTFYRTFQVDDNHKLDRQPIVCGVNLRPMRTGIHHWIQAVTDLPCLKKGVPLSIVPTFDDRVPLKIVDPDCPDRFSMRLYETLDIMIGTAFHSIVFAIQNGIPVIAINYHPKVRRLMEEARLGEFVLEWNDWEDLRFKFDQLLEKRDQVRQKMFDFTNLAHDELVTILQDVKHKINTYEKSGDISSLEVTSEPKVSIIVKCIGARDSEIKKTVQSCLDQTYQNLEIVLVGNAEKLIGIVNNLSHKNRLRVLNMDHDETDWVNFTINGELGEYVTWLHSGEWYAADAIHLLVKLLDRSPRINLVYSNLFLTNDGFVECKIDLHESFSMDEYVFWLPCFLTRRNIAGTVRDIQIDPGSYSEQADSWHIFALHVPHCLMFRPASEGEIYLNRSSLEYCWGESEEAKQNLIRANNSNPELINSLKYGDRIFNYYWQSRSNLSYKSTEVTYLEAICSNLPNDTRELRKLRRVFISRASLAEAFILFNRGQTNGIQYLLLRSILYNPKRLLNRGIISVFIETLLGRPVIQAYRRTKGRIAQMVRLSF